MSLDHLVYIVPTSTIASTTIAEISRLDLQDLSTPSVASITNIKYLSSYNWIKAPTPTITIPAVYLFSPLQKH